MQEESVKDESETMSRVALQENGIEGDQILDHGDR